MHRIFSLNSLLFGGSDAHSQSILSQSVPSIHTVRLNTFMAAVQALTRGGKATVTSLGRNLTGRVYDKHKIKRMDRLLSNKHLCKESHAIYTALIQRILQYIAEPIITIDGRRYVLTKVGNYCVRLFR